MKITGLIGGMGWEGSAIYYRVMNREVRRQLKGSHSARIIMDSLDFETISTAQDKSDYRVVRTTLVESAIRLERAGAQQLVIACNTVHRFAKQISDSISIPLLHIADACAAALVADGHKRVGLLGTRATMQAPFYLERLPQRFALDMIAPQSDSREVVDRLINQELVQGSDPKACAERLDRVVAELKDEGCTAVLLACTDFGIAFGSPDTPRIERELPLYDTAVVHALAAVEAALVPGT